jgi:ligand-binding sensor domain-containing protein
VLLLLLLETPGGVLSEQLPVKNYTIADGLSRDYINRIKQDSHGFIWFCTNEGISRFDGYGFTNYGIAEGLPLRLVFDFLETRDGAYLFATLGGGLVEFSPTGTTSDGSHFTVVTLDANEATKFVTTLIEDETGVIWCATNNGVYRLTREADGWQSTRIRIAPREGDTVPAGALAFDSKGSLWIGTGSGLYRRLPNGNVEHYTVQNGLSQNGISRLLLDRDERMWVGTGDGLTLLVSDPRPNEKIAAQVYTTKDGLSYNHITALHQTSDGRLWVGTRGGLNFFVDPKNNGGLAFRGYTTAQGLRNARIWDITEDRDHNLWLGAESGGAPS